MRNSTTLNKLRDNQTARVCSLGHYTPHYVKHAAEYGYDCIWLDAEHRGWTDMQIQSILTFSHLFNIDIMVRTPTLEKSRLYRLLEDGAAGLMIPHVSTPEKTKMLVDSTKFPPIGDRGLDSAGLDGDFYHGGPDYVEHANRETFLTVQIETLEAVENVDAIAAVPGVDVLFVGPGDLGLRIKHSDGRLTLEDAFERVAAACKKHGKHWGCPVSDAASLAKRQAQGARFLAHGGEFEAIMRMLKESSRAFDDNPVM